MKSKHCVEQQKCNYCRKIQKIQPVNNNLFNRSSKKERKTNLTRLERQKDGLQQSDSRSPEAPQAQPRHKESHAMDFAKFYNSIGIV